MKGKAITKIVLCAVIAVVLTAGLALGLAFSHSGFDWLLGWSSGSTYHDADQYTIGGGSVTTPIRALEIDWSGGEVTIATHDSDEVQFRETGAKNEDEQLRYRVKDGKLIIREHKSGLHQLFTTHYRKNLEVLLPAGSLAELDIDAASATIALENLTIGSTQVDTASGALQIADCSLQALDFDTASGQCTATGTTLGEVSIDSASGSVWLEADVRQLELDTASGDLTLASGIIPEALELDLVSGNCDITLPADATFTVTLDSVSGDLYLDGFAASSVHRGRYTVGADDGGRKYTIDSVSGNLTFHAAPQ